MRRQRESAVHRTTYKRVRVDGAFQYRAVCSCGLLADAELRITARQAAEDAVKHLEDEGLIDV